VNARQTILGQVRAQLAIDATARPELPAPPLLGPHALDASQRLQQFTERLLAAGGKVHLALQAGQPAAVVAGLLGVDAGRTIVFTAAATVLALQCELAGRHGGRELAAGADRADLLAAGAGITAAQWGIAETGTIVLDADAERSRLCSLLPPVHIALLPVTRILATLGEALKTLPRPLPHAVTLVTGPSRTADIELQLVVGVHGPRELHVVLT